MPGYEDTSEFNQKNPRGYDTTLYESKHPYEGPDYKYEDFYETEMVSGSFKNHISYRSEQK